MYLISTYFEPVPEINIEESTRLLLLWRENWESQGYRTQVLNEHIARKHPLFDEYNERIKRFPSINPDGYDRACWMRWLAMVQVQGGFMTDYDLFAYNPDWKDLPIDFDNEICVSQQSFIPCLVTGMPQAFEKVVRHFMNYEVSIKDVELGRPHVSDMHILLRSHAPIHRGNKVMHYGEPGWETRPFVHYANSCMNDHKPRWKTIKQLRDWTKK